MDAKLTFTLAAALILTTGYQTAFGQQKPAPAAVGKVQVEARKSSKSRASRRLRPLTPKQYCRITIARLQMTIQTLKSKNRTASQAEQDALLRRFRTNVHEYLTYGSAKKEEIQSYLKNRSSVRIRVRALNLYVGKLIESLEARKLAEAATVGT